MWLGFQVILDIWNECGWAVNETLVGNSCVSRKRVVMLCWFSKYVSSRCYPRLFSLTLMLIWTQEMILIKKLPHQLFYYKYIASGFWLWEKSLLLRQMEDGISRRPTGTNDKIRFIPPIQQQTMIVLATFYWLLQKSIFLAGKRTATVCMSSFS